MTAPATMAATDPSKSPKTWRKAARVFTFSRSRESDQATRIFTINPTMATPMTISPDTDCGVRMRETASNNSQQITPTMMQPFTKAARISTRP
ncbi:hypothetical protein EVA_08173 [gut metagenome]|uniref:Uncharacterized protein n=1 Tax=gut metagenome TaxID=749906 RepID=J9GA44_9ZZZZ